MSLISVLKKGCLDVVQVRVYHKGDFRNDLLMPEILLMRVQQQNEFRPGKSSWGVESLESQLDME